MPATVAPTPAPSPPVVAPVAPPTVASAAPPRAASPPDYLAPPATPAERQARCTEILQKASLERITADETDYFKRECK